MTIGKSVRATLDHLFTKIQKYVEANRFSIVRSM
jgi:hypothetical protein